MNTMASTETLVLNESFLARRSWFDWVFAALVVAGGLVAFSRYHAAMDIYEKCILAGTVPSLIWLGWFWRPLRVLMLVVTGLALLAIASYQTGGQADLARADQVFWLKYFLSSQSAILWMSMLFLHQHGVLLAGHGHAQPRRGDGADRVAHRLGGGDHGAGRHHGALVREPPDRP